MDLNISQLIQFTDTKRFLASIGIVLVVLSILLPILVLSQPVTNTVNATEMSKLSVLDQYNANLRQLMSLSVTSISLCLAPIMFFSGLAFTIGSFWTWVIFGDKSPNKYENDINKITIEKVM